MKTVMRKAELSPAEVKALGNRPYPIQDTEGKVWFNGETHPTQEAAQAAQAQWYSEVENRPLDGEPTKQPSSAASR